MMPLKQGRRLRMVAALPVLAALLAACGSVARDAMSSKTTAATASGTITVPKSRPQAIEPAAGVQAQVVADSGGAVSEPAPVGDPSAHAPPLSEVRQELRMELVAVSKTNATYIDPLRYVKTWERTDQGVDAVMPVGAPILAPCRVKVLAIIPDWYAGQPLVYWELLDGPQAGQVQYVAEQITDLAQPGSILPQGAVIARFAPGGTGIEFGWSTLNGVTLARATTGYEEGQATPAGQSIRAWLNALGANAGPG
jgi:hypothetical protein